MAKSESTRIYKVLALLIAAMLWAVAHGQSSVEKGFDVPIVFQNVPESLVLTEQNTDVVNVRMRGSRAALRNVDTVALEYPVDARGVRQGEAEFEVDTTRIFVPRGAEIVSRSPLLIEAKFERRGSKVMRVRADLAGDPAQGFEVAKVDVVPPRVRVTGARREVLRLNEVVTEPIDVAGLDADAERQVRLAVAGQHVWVDDPTAVTVRIAVKPTEQAQAPVPAPAKGQAKGQGEGG